MPDMNFAAFPLHFPCYSLILQPPRKQSLSSVPKKPPNPRHPNPNATCREIPSRETVQERIIFNGKKIAKKKIVAKTSSVGEIIG